MKLKTSPAIALSNPLVFLRNVWFNVVLSVKKRRSEAAEENELRVWSWRLRKICQNGAWWRDKKTIAEEWVMYTASTNWQECTKHLTRTMDTKLWSFTWPNSILSAMLSFSIQERILSESMAMKWRPTNWWQQTRRDDEKHQWGSKTAPEPPQLPYGRMLVQRTAT